MPGRVCVTFPRNLRRSNALKFFMDMQETAYVMKRIEERQKMSAAQLGELHSLLQKAGGLANLETDEEWGVWVLRSRDFHNELDGSWADKFKQLAILDQTDDNADGAPSNRSQSVLGLLEAPKHDEAALAKTDDDDVWVEVDGDRRAKRKLQPVPMQPGASSSLGTEELQPSLKKATERAIAEMEDARKDEADFLDADRPFAFLGRKEQHNMEKVFDYEDRMLVDVETGEVTMKWYYMHPGRYKKVWDEKEKEYVLKFVYCGCYFASALWDEYQNAKGQSKWKCEVDWERVQQCFPKDYEMVNKQYGKLLSSEKMGVTWTVVSPVQGWGIKCGRD